MATLKGKLSTANAVRARERIAKNRAAGGSTPKPRGDGGARKMAPTKPVAKQPTKPVAKQPTKPVAKQPTKPVAKQQQPTPEARKPSNQGAARAPVMKSGSELTEDLLTQSKAQQRIALNRARTDLSEAKKLLGRIRADFYEVGVRLKRLKSPTAYRALGFDSFAALVEGELDISLTVADRLVAIVENVSRELATKVGQSHAWALVRLAQATWEDDTPDELATKTLELPTGETLHVPSASVRVKHAAAAALRESRTRAKPRGNTTTGAERDIAREIEASLRALGVTTARVRAHPTRPGRPAELRLQGVPMSALDALCKAICPR